MSLCHKIKCGCEFFISENSMHASLIDGRKTNVKKLGVNFSGHPKLRCSIPGSFYTARVAP